MAAAAALHEKEVALEGRQQRLQAEQTQLAVERRSAEEAQQLRLQMVAKAEEELLERQKKLKKREAVLRKRVTVLQVSLTSQLTRLLPTHTLPPIPPAHPCPFLALLLLALLLALRAGAPHCALPAQGMAVGVEKRQLAVEEEEQRRAAAQKAEAQALEGITTARQAALEQKEKVLPLQLSGASGSGHVFAGGSAASCVLWLVE